MTSIRFRLTLYTCYFLYSNMIWYCLDRVTVDLYYEFTDQVCHVFNSWIIRNLNLIRSWHSAWIGRLIVRGLSSRVRTLRSLCCLSSADPLWSYLSRVSAFPHIARSSELTRWRDLTRDSPSPSSYLLHCKWRQAFFFLLTSYVRPIPYLSNDACQCISSYCRWDTIIDVRWGKYFKLSVVMILSVGDVYVTHNHWSSDVLEFII